MEKFKNTEAHTKPVIWLFGFSGSGKTTIAENISTRSDVYVLDGDVLRDGLCKDLGFSIADRMENIRRAAEVAKIMSEVKTVVACFITPTNEMRAMVRSICNARMIWIDTPLGICEQRDPKGLYHRVRSGHVANFTGIDSIFESPTQYDVKIETVGLSVDQSANAIIDLL